MSTFRGCLVEFPDIRIDYFREVTAKARPLAWFLSHVHSDHLQGLESPGGPFIYCSPATRELLLRLERHPHRMNLAKGILESKIQHYKHLKSRLKAIPLNSPTEIELRTEQCIRVTLLDANHCVGAVMFLIENEARAALYTGDIRSEPWWVNSLARNPVVVPYSHGHKRLDMIYLDTTFASKEDIYWKFPAKAAGISELLEKISMYSKDTVFHFNAWTLGYEDVWIALSRALRSQIHVDDYKCRLYKSLASLDAIANYVQEGFPLFGFSCANRTQAGCLTNDQNVRLHSCERGTDCFLLEKADVVYITPIISRSPAGEVVPEIGTGGGGADLMQAHKVELYNQKEVSGFTKLLSETLDDQKARAKISDFLDRVMLSSKQSVALDALHLGMSNFDLAQHLAKLVSHGDKPAPVQKPRQFNKKREIKSVSAVDTKLPRTIQFPYSRHSSYEELCDLVGAFKPADVFPCTVDEESWGPEVSVQTLFGHLCSETIFAHDREMETLVSQRATSNNRRDSDQSQITTSPREGSVEANGDAVLGNANRYSSDPTPYLDLPDDLNRRSKRQRTEPPDAGNEHEDVSSAQQQLHEIRHSFREHYLKQREVKKASSARTSFVSNLPRGTQNEPIELSDAGSSDSGGEADNFLLGEMPEPYSIPNTAPGSQSAPETQVSLSDAAFESQSPHHSAAETKAATVQNRKEAYKAARELGGTWERDHGLITSHDGHGEEELEL